jgi:hypothetical protein
MYSGEYDACDVTLSVYPHHASLKNMPDHGALTKPNYMGHIWTNYGIDMVQPMGHIWEVYGFGMAWLPS